jgi:hypothetical protein
VICSDMAILPEISRRLDDVTLLAATISTALLGNAFICGVISGPHDRYGARLVWIATFVVLIALERYRVRMMPYRKQFADW